MIKAWKFFVHLWRISDVNLKVLIHLPPKCSSGTWVLKPPCAASQGSWHQQEPGLQRGIQLWHFNTGYTPRITYTSRLRGSLNTSQLAPMKDNAPHILSYFYFSRKIRESLECFPVKLNNLIHILAQMSTSSPAKPASHTEFQESWEPGATKSIQRATILGFSKRHRHVSSLSSFCKRYLPSSQISLHYTPLPFPRVNFLLCKWRISYNSSRSAIKRMFQGNTITTKAITRKPSKRTAPTLWQTINQ